MHVIGESRAEIDGISPARVGAEGNEKICCFGSGWTPGGEDDVRLIRSDCRIIITVSIFAKGNAYWCFESSISPLRPIDVEVDPIVGSHEVETSIRSDAWSKD